LKHAKRLNKQRENNKPLNCCIQINIDLENSKAGIQPDQIPIWLEEFKQFNNLKLRGFMCIPQAGKNTTDQKASFSQMHQLLKQYQITQPQLDTLSMGMSGDMQFAITEGSSIVRIGTAIFGPRHYS